MTIPQWTPGERLAKARKDAGLSQQQMADLLEVSRGSVTNWERMKHQATQNGGFLKMIARWADITNVEPAWLLGLSTGNETDNLRYPIEWDDQDIYPIPRGQLALLAA